MSNLQIKAIEILPNVTGMIRTPRFFPKKEKKGTFNKSNAPIKPNNTKRIEVKSALIKDVVSVDVKELFPDRFLKEEKLN